MIKSEIGKPVERPDPTKVSVSMDLLRPTEKGKEPDPMMVSLAIIDLLDAKESVPQFSQVYDIYRLVKRDPKTSNQALREKYV